MGRKPGQGPSRKQIKVEQPAPGDTHRVHSTRFQVGKSLLYVNHDDGVYEVDGVRVRIKDGKAVEKFEPAPVATHQYRVPKEGIYRFPDGRLLKCNIDDMVDYTPGSGHIEWVENTPWDANGVDRVPGGGLVLEEDLPELDEYKIRDEMFLPPKDCQHQHIYTAMKVALHFSDLGTQLFYGCPHNIHLRRALLELQLAHEACNKAIMSDVEKK